MLRLGRRRIFIRRWYSFGEKRLRKHQIEAVNAVENAFRSGEKRATLVLPGGSGKTMIGNELIKRSLLENQLALLVTPTLALIDQSLKDWSSTSTPFPKILVVSSQIASSNIFMRSTDINQLAPILEKLVQEKKKVVCISTYHSLDKLEQAMRRSDLKFDLAIFDEAHVTTYATQKKDRGFALGLQPNFSADKRVFMTATPRIQPAKYSHAWHSMDNPDLYGKIVYKLTTQDSVDRKITVPLTLLVVDATKAYLDYRKKTIHKSLHLIKSDNETRDTKREQQQQQLDRELRDLELASVLAQVQKEYNANRFFVFHTSNQRSEDFVERARDLWRSMPKNEASAPAEFSIDRVYGGMNPNDRQSKLEVLHAQDETTETLRVVTNVNVLSQGVDIPLVDAVVLADPRRSEVSIAQIAARAARAAPGKKRGIIVVPVRRANTASRDETSKVADLDPKFDISRDDFSTIINVLQAVATDDAPTNKYWQAQVADAILATENGENNFIREYNKGGPISNRQSNAGPLLVMDDALSRSLSRGLRLAAISLDEVEWELRYKRLEAYKADFGHCDVPYDFIDTTETGGRLGLWVFRQRLAYRNSKLSSERLELLEKLGFKWKLRDSSKWFHFYQEWIETRRFQVSKEIKRWIRQNQISYWRKKLSKSRITLLEENEFDWGTEPSRKIIRSPPIREIFDDALKTYINYKKEHYDKEPTHRCDTPILYQRAGIDDHPQRHRTTLGTWIQLLRSNNLNLSKDQRNQLIAAGFPFSRTSLREHRFEKDLAKLTAFKEIHGHTVIPKNFHDQTFVNRISRMRYGLGLPLTPEQRNALNELGFAWSLRKGKAQQAAARLHDLNTA